jgi:recombination associated protein RdgC
LEDLEAVLEQTRYVPCGATDEISVGWVPARGEDHAAMVENIGGHLILKLAVERKAVPASAVKAETEKRVKQIENERGSRPGRKEIKEIKEDVYLQMLPRAFSKRATHYIWIDPTNRTVVVGAGGYKAADLVVNQIVEACAAANAVIPIAPISTNTSPSSAMSQWLSSQTAPFGFSVDRDLELKSFDEDKATIRYAHHNLELDEIVEHIKEGKVPTQLALTWGSHVSFMLTSEMLLKKIELLEVVTEVIGDDDNGFDSDVALTTGELVKLIPDLLAALDDEMDQAATS